jgi:HAD superfamily hydrolase (TIGR01509 family)
VVIVVLQQVSCVLFDLDGTLVDSTPAVLESYRHAFRNVLNADLPDDPETTTEILTIRFFDYCAMKAGPRADEFALAFRERYLGALDAPPQPYPDVLRVLEDLAAHGISTGVVTNKTRRTTEHELLRCGLDVHPFACVITADEASIGKPDPLPIRLGVRAARSRTDETIYVGDGPHDVVAAHAAGLPAVGAAYGDWGTSALAKAGADVLIQSPPALLEHVLNRAAR